MSMMYNSLLAMSEAENRPTELDPLQAGAIVQSSSPISPLPNSQLAVANASLSIGSPPHCRYCLGRNHSLNYSEDHESLIGPCRCKGSVGLVHPGCLMRWLQVSRKFRCELCGFDLRQSDRLALLPQFEAAAAAAAAAAAEVPGAQGTDDPAALTDVGLGGPVAPSLQEWLRQPEQACCIAMTICCLVLVVPLIAVLIYFVSELRRQAGSSTAGGAQDYQVILFELLTGFVTVAVLVWLIYGSVTCGSRHRVWRRALRRQREATAIVSLENA